MNQDSLSADFIIRAAPSPSANGPTATAIAPRLTSPMKKKDVIVEQKFLDDIIAMFGPSLEELSMKQDDFRSSRSPLSSERNIPSSSRSLPGQPSRLLTLSNAAGRQQEQHQPPLFSGMTPTLLFGTTQAPQHNPRIILSHSNQVFNSLHVPWLRELKIVYSAVMDGPHFLTPSSIYSAAASPSPCYSSPSLTIPRTPMDTIDLSVCEALEVLWIEDFDDSGRPHQLRRLYERGESGQHEDIVPFHQDQGLKLPASLKSIEMVGFSAEKFNFGWLRATTKLEYLNITGVRRRTHSLVTRAQYDNDSIAGERPGESLWQWEGIELPYLKHLAVHHSPAQHFRFQILNNCPRLESVDIRNVPVEATQVPDATIQDNLCCHDGTQQGHQHRVASGVILCRLEILRVTQEFVAESAITFPTRMKAFLERYLPNVTKLHLDGLSIRLLIELTTGPPSRKGREQHRREQSTASIELESEGKANLPHLEQVLTEEKMSASDVLKYSLIPARGVESVGIKSEVIPRAERAPPTATIESFGLRMHSVTYTIQGKIWQRVASSVS
ncbi:hypothetical protein BGX28_009255 [Mortierella sp. GBA30]|nr:hypothetical protein BGX28_009255 [Mortierella sp. GBA30]